MSRLEELPQEQQHALAELVRLNAGWKERTEAATMARRALEASMLRAHDLKCSMQMIADALGVSKSRVQAILGTTRGDER